MDNFPVVYRRDMLLADCLVCDSRYVETLIPELVLCTNCGDTVSRWMTKSEIIFHINDNSIKKAKGS